MKKNEANNYWFILYISSFFCLCYLNNNIYHYINRAHCEHKNNIISVK